MDSTKALIRDRVKKWWDEAGEGPIQLTRHDLYDVLAALSAQGEAAQPAAEGQTYRIEHDGFEGTVQGAYVTREGKRGVVLQQIGTRVVHVYSTKWLEGQI